LLPNPVRKTKCRWNFEGQGKTLDTASGKFEQSILTIGEMQVISAADELFNHCDDERPMWKGEGDREVRVAFTFDEPFNEPPSLNFGVTGIDCDEGRNVRYGVSTENVTKDGFEVSFVTWSDTLIARASISWQAVGSAQKRAVPARPVKSAPKKKSTTKT